MKKLSNLLNFWRWIVLCIFSISYSAAKSQCRIECNTNAGIYSDNNARTIAYDNMGSGFHSTFVSEKNGFRVWGENMQNNGTGHHLSPVTINSTNYPALTGTVYFVGIGSEWAGNVQLIVLTSTGLFASGTPGAVLSTGIKSTNAFSKLTINGKTDGLPSGITPDSVKMMFVCAETIIITTCGGRVFVLAQSARVRGDLSVTSSSANAWSQVMRAAGQPLTNIIATRGTDRAAFALAADSTIWTWGDNILLGNSTARVNRDYASQMTKPSGLGGIKMIQMTNFNFNYTFNQTSYYVLGTNNRIYSLGENNNGQLGDNTTTNRLAWVNVLNPNGTTVTDATWITANEHDPNLPNLGFIRTNAQMVTCGNNSLAMIGRVNGTALLIGATNHPDIPIGINSNDTILFCEIGGHTSAFIKYNTPRYGYVGHRVNGSVGDNSAVNSTLTSVNFVIPPIINVCGTRCDTPKIYGKPFNCNDSVMYFVIKSKSGNKIKYQINNNPADSVIIGISDSVILTLTNIGASQTLKILKVENIACNLSVAVNDTLKFTTRKDSFRTICKNQSVVFNGQTLNTTGVYRDTFVNSKGCDSFLYLHLTVNDTTKKDSFLSICRYNPIVFNGQTLNTNGVYRDTFVNARGCDSFLYLLLTVNDTSRKDSFRTICKNQPIIFNGNSLNISGVYRDTFVNSKGCDSFLVLNLTVNDTTRKDSFRTICKNQSVVFNGQTLNTTGVYRDTFVNAKGCDSFLYLHLTVNDTTRKDSFRTICKNQPITFNGNILNTTGIYKDTFINAKGCDSFLYLHLTVNDTTKKDSFLAICRYNPIVFNGQTLSTSGVYRDTLVNARGCDSFLYLHLTVNDTSRKDSFRTICKNQPIIFNGNSLNISGVYRDTFVNSKGCDSFLVLNLTVNDTTKKDSFRTICKNQSVVFNGQTLNTTGVYRDTFMNSKGCDSFLYLHLTVNDTTRKDSFRTICKNQPITFNGNILNTTGVYRDTFINSNGCDSFLVLHLTVNDTTKKDSFRTICRYNPIVFNGQTLSTSGVYRDTFVNARGCDSFLYLHLTVNDTSRKDSFRTICKNQPIIFNGNSLNISGVYRDTFANIKGCDSFLVLNLTVNDTTKKDSFRTICKNQSVVFNGQTLNTTGVYRDTFMNSKGCDSFLYLHLTVNDTTRKDSFRTICKNQPITFNGNILNTTGVYRDTFVNSIGCDSFLVLNLTVNDTTKKDSFLAICRYNPIVFNGQTLSTSGVYRDTFVNARGCDSFLYLHLTVNDTSRKDSFRTICKNQPIIFNGNSLNVSGIYRDTFVNSKGCDSFLVLNLTVNDTTKKDSFRTICKNQSMVFNGQTLSTTGVYRDTFMNSKGCDSFLYLHLTVNDTTRKDSFRTICKNQPITFNGNILNTTGIYKDTFVNAKGCDSFLYLHLTVNDTTKKDSFLTICRYNPIIFNGQTLSTSGVYRDTFVNARGCDSFLYLHLTVNDTSRKDSFRTICKNQPIIFNGNSLNITGIYHDTFVNSKGCDSFLVLTLTVNDTTKKDSFRTICKNQSVVFNGQTLNTTGVYRDTFLNSKGCDSFLYLHLTVNDTTRKDSFRTICRNQSVVFNGNILNTTGVYRDTFVNSIGCDSFLVLNLTVNDTTKKDSFLAICRYNPIVFNGQTLSTSGVYRDTFVNARGCDSFLYLHLTVNDTSRKDSFRTICKNQPIIFNGNSLNISGIYRDTFVNSKGCDSFLVLNLIVNDTTKKDSFRTICKNQSVVFNGQTLNTTGVYRDTFLNSKGCDSFLYLHLTVNDTTRKDSFRTICRNQSVVFNGNILNTTGVYRDTFVNSIGCDSFLVLNLTVNDTTKKDSFLAICRYNPIVFNGQTLSTSGVYRDTFVNARGCDSFLYLHLTVNDTSRKDSFRTICKNQPIIFNGNSLNISGIYRDTFVNSKGCDSFLVLNLIVNDTTKKDSFRTICKNQMVTFNGQNLNTTGIYRDTFLNSKGCDSFLYLHLTVNDTTRKDSFRTICKNQPITFNGNILNTTGIYKDTFINAKGCDSFLYLHLTVNDTTKKDSFLAICRYNPIVFNGQNLSTSGVYRDTFVNARGCDSFLYLHLTVNDTSRKDSFRTICKNQPIIFNGNSLNISGVYRDTFINAKGCDSFLVLNLIVNDTTKKDSFRTICKNQSVVFNGQTLNTTGVYRDTFMNSKGCDSFLYLHLTVNDTTRKDSFRTICKNQPITFNGNILNTTGIYKDTFINAKGCDSFLYLHLTVNDTTNYFFTKNICQGDSFYFNSNFRLNGGNFKDTLINIAGCDSFVYLQLIVNPLPIANAGRDTIRINCSGDSVQLGSASISNHSYRWFPDLNLSNGRIAQPYSKVASTTTYYMIIVNDITNCENTDTIKITVRESQMEVESITYNLKCKNSRDGMINLQAKKGFAPYQYKLSQMVYQDSGLFKNLPAGFNQYTVRDMKSCLFSDTFSLAEPTAIETVSKIRKHLTCYQSNDGEIEIIISGGTRPYSYLWTPSGDKDSILKNLSATTYSLVLLDSNKCYYTDTVVLSEPPPIVIQDTIQKRNPCFGDSLGSIEVKLAGGTQPYRYLWSNGKREPKTQNLKQDTFYLKVTDTNNCIENFKIPLIKDPMPLLFDSLGSEMLNCQDFTNINLSGIGGTKPYVYSIDSGISFRSQKIFRVSEARLYHVQIMDANKCLTRDTHRVKGTEKIEIEVYPKDTIVGMGEPVELGYRYIKGDSTKVQSFIWKPGDGLSCTDCRNPIATPYVPMIYTIEVIYNDNCYHSDNARIRHTLDELFIPNAFSPDGPNIENQTLRIYSNNIYKAKLSIFNRWGEKIFESHEAHRIGWDGTFKGKKLNYDVFVYSAEIIYLSGRKVVKSGEVTLIR